MLVYLIKTAALVLAVSPFAIWIALLIIDWRLWDGRFSIVGWIIFGLGAVISITNFYNSVLRYWLFKLRGRLSENLASSSSIPLLGILVLVGNVFIPNTIWLNIAVPILLLLDTGGISWFVVMVWKDDEFWGKTF